MKFIYVLLAIAALIVASSAQFCNVGVCVKEGENYNSVVDITCEFGTFCPTSSVIFTPVCTKLSGPGETCNTPFTQCAEPYQCRQVNNMFTCAMPAYLGFGESCNSNYQCGAGLTCNNEICSLKPNVICSNDYQCPFGQFCNGTTLLNTPVQCRPLYASGDKCTRDSQCPYDNYCGLKQGDTSGDFFCQPSFNKVQGDVCSVHGAAFVELSSGFRYECAATLVCAGGTCQAPQNEIPTGDCMDATVNCPSTYGSSCECTSTSQVKTGKCSSSPFNLNSNCQTSVKNLVSCAIENECPSIEGISLGPDSCLMKHCKSELCDNNNCVALSSNSCGDQPVYPVCNAPSSSSVVLPSFVLLIVAIIALLF
ncbi:hypothetical protein ACTFIU_007339 [Dictyostelium citrinum]